MVIRALTGFSEETIQKYGRSYSPLNGNCTVLGAVGSQQVEENTSKEPKKINPLILILLGVGAYAIYKNLK